MRRIPRWSALTLWTASLCLTARAGAQADSSVQPRVSRPASELALRVIRVDTTRRPSASTSSATQRLARNAITGVWARARPTQQPAPSPRTASTTLATQLYGSSARLETAVAISRDLDLVWLRPDSATTRPNELPFRIYGRLPGSDTEVSLTPVIDTRDGIRYRPADRMYGGALLLGFRDSLRPGRPIPLATPLRLGVGGTLESVAPASIAVPTLNVVDTRVTLANTRRPTEAIVVLHPDHSAEAVEVRVPVLIDSLMVTAPERMRGLGTEEAEIVIGLPRGSLAPDDSLEVTVRPLKGALSPSGVVYVRENASARVRLRSAGLGAERLTLTSSLLDARGVSIQYGIPWLLLVIAIVGAASGVLLRWWKARARNARARIPWPRAAISVLIVAAASVGLERLGLGYLAGFSEAGTFVFAAIVAGGVKMLAWNE